MEHFSSLFLSPSNVYYRASRGGGWGHGLLFLRVNRSKWLSLPLPLHSRHSLRAFEQGMAELLPCLLCRWSFSDCQDVRCSPCPRRPTAVFAVTVSLLISTASNVCLSLQVSLFLQMLLSSPPLTFPSFHIQLLLSCFLAKD